MLFLKTFRIFSYFLVWLMTVRAEKLDGKETVQILRQSKIKTERRQKEVETVQNWARTQQGQNGTNTKLEAQFEKDETETGTKTRSCKNGKDTAEDAQSIEYSA